MLTGLMVAAAFAPISLWPLAPLGVMLFCLVVREGARTTARPLRRSMWWGWLMGLGLFSLLVGWIGVLGWYVAVALVAFLAIWGLLLGLGTALTSRLPAWPLFAAAMWSLVEWASSRFPFGGFGWMRLGYTTPDQPLSGFLPWIGVVGSSFAVALVGTCLAAAVEAVREGGARRFPRAAPALAVVVGLFGLGALAGLRGALPASGSTLTVGFVQGNVDGTAGSQAMGYARSVTNNHLSETIMMMARARTDQLPMPDFLVWPENATDIDPTSDLQTQVMVEQAVNLAGMPIFVGAVMDGPGEDERQTSGLWWDPRKGLTARYDKRNLVPFGEFIPFRSQLLPLMPILEQVGSQSVPGTQPGVLTVDVNGEPLRLGDVICFELAWDSTVHDTAQHDSQLTVVQSNNATYTGTGQPHQQFQITRARAMELRREILVSTTSSYSGMIDPKGRVVQRTNEATSASGSHVIPLRTGITPAVTIAPWLERALALCAVVGMGWGWLGLRRGGTKETR